MKLTHILIPLFLLASAGARSVVSQDWGRQVRASEAALRSHDVEKWHLSLRALKVQDHPAAAGFVLLFFAEQVRYEGEWKSGRRPEHGAFLSGDPVRFYGRLLRGTRNPRSVRYLVYRLADPDPAVADLCARALSGNPHLHVADDELRTGYRKALGGGNSTLARRFFAVLRDRLHVGDAAWVRREVQRSGVSADLRRALLTAYMDLDLWRELRLTMGDEVPLGGGPGIEFLDRVLLEADRVDAVIAEHPRGGIEVWERGFASLGLRCPHEALGAVYVRRVSALLAGKPQRQLRRLHDASTKLRLARTLRRDVYFHPERQRQDWDRLSDTSRLESIATTIDFAAPEWSDGVGICIRLRELLAAPHGGGRPQFPGPPWHYDLLRLNRERPVGVETIAFSPAERKWLDLRDEILAANERSPIPTEAERGNVAILNAYRRNFALMPLRIDKDLTASARNHCRFQKAMGAIAHVFPNVREPFGRTPRDRMVNAGYPREHAGGENIYFGKREARAAFDWWRRSSGHRRNMLSPAWTEVGVGEVEAYWVQNFGTRP